MRRIATMTRIAQAALIATAAIAATATPAVAATGDCEVQHTDGSGKVTGTTIIKNGASIPFGGNTTISCKDGNVTVTQTNPKAISLPPLPPAVTRIAVPVTNLDLSLTRGVTAGRITIPGVTVAVLQPPPSDGPQ